MSYKPNCLREVVEEEAPAWWTWVSLWQLRCSGSCPALHDLSPATGSLDLSSSRRHGKGASGTASAVLGGECLHVGIEYAQFFLFSEYNLYSNLVACFRSLSGLALYPGTLDKTWKVALFGLKTLKLLLLVKLFSI